MNWIESRPQEFVNLLQTGARIEGGADVLFDQVHNMASVATSPKELRSFRPAKMALLLICPDILTKAMHGETKGGVMTKKTVYLEVLRKGLRSTVVEDAILQAYINACRAGATIPLGLAGTGLQDLVGDIMRSLKDGLLGDAQISEQRDSNLLIDGFCSLYLVKPPFAQNVVPGLTHDSTTIKVRQVLATSAWILETQTDIHPQRKSTQQLKELLAPALRRWLKMSVRALLSAQSLVDNTAMRGYAGGLASQTPQDATRLVQSVLALYAIEPSWAYEGAALVPRLMRTSPVGDSLQTELSFDARLPIDVNEDSVASLIMVLSSLHPKTVSDGYRDGLEIALRSIQRHFQRLECKSALNIGLKRTLFRIK